MPSDEIVRVERENLDTREAAQFLGLSTGKLNQDRFRGEGIPYIVLSRGAIRYRLSDLRAYLASRLVVPGQDPRPDLPRRKGGPGRPPRLTKARVRGRPRRRAA
jgi:hypothetical protein